MKSNRILHMDSDIPSIYFPVGTIEDGGTCAFATEKCMEYCPSGFEPNEHEKYALEFFKTNDAKAISRKIIADYQELINETHYYAEIIQWHVWGDCLPELTDKTFRTMLDINRAEIPQYGFTRNRELWNLIPTSDIFRIGFTTDDPQEAIELSRATGKMLCSPDIEHGYAQMFHHGKLRSRCSGWWCITEEETRNSDCRKCLKLGQGCFYRRNGEQA